jgi:prophage DNA circulation protein
MAWEKTLLEATFRGIVFDVVKTDDDFSHATVEHSYPYVNGSDVEDMGRGARRISVEAVFYGDDYETRLDAFLNALDQPNAGEFIHPVFGSIKNAQAVHYPVHHDADNPDQATLVIEFIESTPGNPFFDAKQSAALKADAIASKAAAVKKAAIDKEAGWLTKFRAMKPFAGLQKLRDAIMEPILAVMAFVSDVQAAVGDVVNEARQWGNAMASLTNGLLDLRDWARGLEGEWLSIRNDLMSLEIFFTSSSDAPAPMTGNEIPTEEMAVAVVQLTIDLIVTATLAEAAAAVFSAEAQSFSIAAGQELSPVKIEDIANDARERIERCISHARSVYTPEQCRDVTEPLKELALAVQEAARAIIEARPPLVRRIINAPSNMRLTAHHLYGDHTRATELYRLNGARRPFIEAGDAINAYAS